MLGVFSEFERKMIKEHVRAGMSRVKAKIARDGKFETKAARSSRRRLGRPGAEPHQIEQAAPGQTQPRPAAWEPAQF
jgi:DNA invertase Pin-like site-specific DNA recombinase